MASRKNFTKRVEQRQASAKARQEAYDKLTAEEKLARATPGSKQFHKLVDKLPKAN